MVNKSTIAAVQDFYLEASYRIHKSEGGTEESTHMFPQHKVLSFSRGRYRYVEMFPQYTVLPFVSGTTTIWYENTVVMTVQYRGWAQMTGQRFLEQALFDAHSKGVWYGGRGDSEFRKEGIPLIYRNKITRRTPHTIDGEETVQGVNTGTFFAELSYNVIIVI